MSIYGNLWCWSTNLERVHRFFLFCFVLFSAAPVQAQGKDLSRISAPVRFNAQWFDEEKFLLITNDDESLTYELSWYAPDNNQFVKKLDRPNFLTKWVGTYVSSMGLTAQKHEKGKISGKIVLDIYARPQEPEDEAAVLRTVFFVSDGEIYSISGTAVFDEGQDIKFPDDEIYKYLIDQF
jgi:hypothetical protein